MAAIAATKGGGEERASVHVAGYSPTNDRVSATLGGSNGLVSRSTLISAGAGLRNQYTSVIACNIGAGDLGTALRNLTISLSGNDGVYFDEFVATYPYGPAGNTYRWVRGPSTGATWLLDGNSRPPRPRVTVDAATAYTEITGSPTTTFNLTAVTSSASGSNTNSNTQIIIYGTNGFVGPLRLATSFSRGSTRQFSYNIPDIGSFIELKVGILGNDGSALSGEAARAR